MSQERLLGERGAPPRDAYVQNRQTQAHFVFSGDAQDNRKNRQHGQNGGSGRWKQGGTGHDDRRHSGGGDDSIEMSVFQRNLTSRKNHNPWKQEDEQHGSPSSAAAASRTATTTSAYGQDPNTTFILHEVEGHHTLTGIALQYRTTVDQLKRLNNIWGEAELHARKVIKVPASRFGHLYAAVQESNLDDLDGMEEGVKTYTTKRPFLPTENPNISLPSEAFSRISYGDDDNSQHDSEEEPADSSEVLAKYDAQLQTVMEHQARLESSSVADARVIGLLRRENAWTTFTSPGMWKRAVAILVVMVVLVPVAVYKLYPQQD
ncbi:hypothetical protein PTSG_00383 [Salpingoeca rosetta]|uniref:LysM domain-containing protein n=1 Tax=Salpingoeca rosetta (strain ATCC 50818 / BSB-021) TaxID=946362 RepID=F2TWB7_SALR5|nr:uncharacterized protein PTSG_00383 [Salpingoeca rosetta]EGD72363.1 hypothetical protein PTSG_00383 [Salpingoeca rosetta]|eukprot:XP_004998932.1 hypothetical protein PTSG_00383 [Salpingoeca rosetta]